MDVVCAAMAPCGKMPQGLSKTCARAHAHAHAHADEVIEGVVRTRSVEVAAVMTMAAGIDAALSATAVVVIVQPDISQTS